jgi:hypothetical protein
MSDTTLYRLDLDAAQVALLRTNTLIHRDAMKGRLELSDREDERRRLQSLIEDDDKLVRTIEANARELFADRLGRLSK